MPRHYHYRCRSCKGLKSRWGWAALERVLWCLRCFAHTPHRLVVW